MFYNTTTIWHKPHPQQNFFKERRTPYGTWQWLKGIGSSVVGGVAKTGHFTKKVAKSWPVRSITYPLTFPTRKTIQGARWLYKKATWGGNYGKELGLGVVGKENSVGRSLFELLMAPVNYVKHVVLGTRELVKGVFTTPLNILKSPINAWRGFREGISNTRKNIIDTFSNINSNSPLQALNSTRKSIQSLIGTPFRAIWKPTREVADAPIKVTREGANAVLSYPRAIPASLRQVRGTISRILNAHNTTSSLMKEREEREKLAMAAIEGAPATAPAPA